MIDYSCQQCEGRGEILISGSVVTEQDLADDLHAQHWVRIDAKGKLWCKECGGKVQVATWKRNGSRFWHNDKPDLSDQVHGVEERAKR